MYNEYVTTNIRLPKELWKSLKNKALEENKSLAKLLREYAMHIIEGKKLTRTQFKNDPFYKIIGKGKGKKDGAVKHDQDIYGNKDFC
ncbi:MAG: hypothetical protein Q8O27_00580 [Enterobacteriaceae bacterium]|nr:hypothetical protein [Enterobacteriaceae bacterium]